MFFEINSNNIFLVIAYKKHKCICIRIDERLYLKNQDVN